MKKNIYLSICAFILSAGMINAQSNLPSGKSMLRKDAKSGRNTEGTLKSSPLMNSHSLISFGIKQSSKPSNTKGGNGISPMMAPIFHEDFTAGMPSDFMMIDGDGNIPAAQVAGYMTDAWIAQYDFLDSANNSCAYSTSYYTPAGTSDDWMITPAITIPSGAGHELSWMGLAIDPAYPDGYEVLISTTGTNPGDFTDVVYTTAAEASSWTKRKVDLTGYAGNTIYVAFHNNSTDMYLLMIDDIDVSPIPSFDAGIDFVYGPLGGCNSTSSDAVNVRIKNYGISPISNFDVGFSINGTPYTETVSSTINSGDTLFYTFTNTANLSAAGSYAISIYTMLNGDADMTNDTVSYSVDVLTPIDVSTPFTMGFETGESLTGWLLEDVNNDGVSWGLSATRGNNAPYAATIDYNTDGVTGGDDFLFSPCFDFTAGNMYQIDFYYKVGLGYMENLALMIGNAPTASAMTQQIVDLPGIVNDTYELSTNQFTVPTSGIYYFGWHSYSDADQWYTAIDDINVSVPTKINEKKDEIRFSISPNPSNTGIFSLSSTSRDVKTEVKIVNAMGQVIFYSKNIVNGEIDLSAQPEGVYFAELNTAGSIVNKKIVITGK
jgi:hypothetical protein